MAYQNASNPARTNKLHGKMPKNGFLHGLLLGMGAIGYFGYISPPPPSYSKNGAEQDLRRIGGDMYAGLRMFNEQEKA